MCVYLFSAICNTWDKAIFSVYLLYISIKKFSTSRSHAIIIERICPQTKCGTLKATYNQRLHKRSSFITSFKMYNKNTMVKNGVKEMTVLWCTDTCNKWQYLFSLQHVLWRVQSFCEGQCKREMSKLFNSQWTIFNAAVWNVKAEFTFAYRWR